MLNPHQVRVNPEYLVAELLCGNPPDAGDESGRRSGAVRQPNDDLTQWTFTLRPDLRFSDGSPLTAADVVASLQALLDPKNASPALHNIGPIKTVSAKDNNTVLIETEAPYADLPVMLAYPDAKIIPAHIAQGQYDKLSSASLGRAVPAGVLRSGTQNRGETQPALRRHAAVSGWRGSGGVSRRYR